MQGTSVGPGPCSWLGVARAGDPPAQVMARRRALTARGAKGLLGGFTPHWTAGGRGTRKMKMYRKRQGVREAQG